MLSTLTLIAFIVVYIVYICDPWIHPFEKLLVCFTLRLFHKQFEKMSVDSFFKSENPVQLADNIYDTFDRGVFFNEGDEVKEVAEKKNEQEVFCTSSKDESENDFFFCDSDKNPEQEVFFDEIDEQEVVVKPYIIGVAGPTCSGKTTVSNILHAACDQHGKKCTIIPQDNYYFGGDATTNFDDPKAINFRLLNFHLSELKAGRSIQMPQYDFTIHSPTNVTITVHPTEIIILEGIFIFVNDETANLLDSKIFIKAGSDNCLNRRINRDVDKRKRTREEVISQYERDIKESNKKYVKPSMNRANLVLNNNAEFNFIGIGFLISHLVREKKRFF
jgi:uridine kinase